MTHLCISEGCRLPRCIINTDSLRNILSNKYTALYRLSAKDAADIVEIAKNISFNWKEIIDGVNQKEEEIDLKEAAQILTCFTEEAFQYLKWIEKPDIKMLRKNIDALAVDMLYMRDRSLCGYERNT